MTFLWVFALLVDGEAKGDSPEGRAVVDTMTDVMGDIDAVGEVTLAVVGAVMGGLFAVALALAWKASKLSLPEGLTAKTMPDAQTPVLRL